MVREGTGYVSHLSWLRRALAGANGGKQLAIVAPRQVESSLSPELIQRRTSLQDSLEPREFALRDALLRQATSPEARGAGGNSRLHPIEVRLQSPPLPGENIYSCALNPRRASSTSDLDSAPRWQRLRSLGISAVRRRDAAGVVCWRHQQALIVSFGSATGLGDRHGSNVMIDVSTGGLLHIDFGMAFGECPAHAQLARNHAPFPSPATYDRRHPPHRICAGFATTTLPVPELIPFRLTRQMLGVLAPVVTRVRGADCSRHSATPPRVCWLTPLLPHRLRRAGAPCAAGVGHGQGAFCAQGRAGGDQRGAELLHPRAPCGVAGGRRATEEEVREWENGANHSNARLCHHRCRLRSPCLCQRPTRQGGGTGGRHWQEQR